MDNEVKEETAVMTDESGAKERETPRETVAENKENASGPEKDRRKKLWAGSGVAAVAIGLLLAAWCRNPGKAEIDFVMNSPFAGNPALSTGAAIETRAKDVKWRLLQNDAGIKCVEAVGMLPEAGRAYCLAAYGSAGNPEFYRAIPEVKAVLFDHDAKYRALWDLSMAGKMAQLMSRDGEQAVRRFRKAEDRLDKGETIVAAVGKKHALPATDKGFRAAVKAAKKARKAEQKSEVRFKMQFPLPVAFYNAKGKFDPQNAAGAQGGNAIGFDANGEINVLNFSIQGGRSLAFVVNPPQNAVRLKGDSTIFFTQGPLAGMEIEADLEPVFQ